MALTAADVAMAIDGMDKAALSTLCRVVGLRPRPMASVAQLLTVRMRHLTPERAHNAALAIVANIQSELLAMFDVAGDSLLDEFESALPKVLAAWPKSLVRLLVVVFQETSVVGPDETAQMLKAIERQTGDQSHRPDSYQRSERSPERPQEFVTLDDRLFIDAAAAAAPGVPSRDLLDHVAALLRVPAEERQPGQWLVLGVAQGYGLIDGESEAFPEAGDRLHWRAAGLLLAAAMTRDVEGVARWCRKSQTVEAAVHALPRHGASLRDALETLVHADPLRLVSSLVAITQPMLFVDELVDIVRVRAFDAPEGPDFSERLLRDLDAVVTRWSASVGALPDADVSSLSRCLGRIRTDRARLRRMRGDYAGSLALLHRVPRTVLPMYDRVAVAREEVFGELGISDIASLSVPRQRRRLVLQRRLSRCVPALREILEHEPADVLARLALGLQAIFHGEDDVAIELLEGLPEELEAGGATELAAEVRFHRGIAALRLLEPGRDEAAAADLVVGLQHGYRPSRDEIIAACELLEVHQSAALDSVILAASRDQECDDDFAAVIARRARLGSPGIEAVAERLGRRPGTPALTRFTLLEAALTGAATRGDRAMVERLVDEAEGYVLSTNNAEIDARWASVLERNDFVRDIVDPIRADLMRAGVLRAAGDLELARGLLRRLFFRAAAGAFGSLDPLDLIELLEQAGAPPDEIDELKRVLPVGDRPGSPPVKLPEHARVLFIGGDETQARQAPRIERQLCSEFGNRVSVEWFTPGWSSNWLKDAQRIEARYEAADAVVLMTFVRTLLGRRLRRTAGEASLPWIACTGHGHASIHRAITRAVEVAARLDRHEVGREFDA